MYCFTEKVERDIICKIIRPKMKIINIKKLTEEKEKIRQDYQSKKPFRYVMFDGFFNDDQAEIIYRNYPSISEGKWDGTTYINQKNKFQKTKFEEGTIMSDVFKEMNSKEFLSWLMDVTEVEDELLADDDLFGGGLHQSIRGAFLNVHIDYNIHPVTKYHRRLNVLVYMNKDWKEEYEGHLELWDLSKSEQHLLARIQPVFNRCVIFETNEISFHGHPKPLKTPADINRKSIATYYYTKTRPENEIAGDHNTIYVNTEKLGGQIKKFTSGVKALLERINRK
jgi:Rps23 Pro-64 3,4-dihydroxylase Tpa1-like proline 4-hydroxylase